MNQDVQEEGEDNGFLRSSSRDSNTYKKFRTSDIEYNTQRAHTVETKIQFRKTQ